MIRTLREFYGLQPTPPADLFQFLVWEIVSLGALPARRDLAWHALRRMPALTPDAMFRAPAKAVLEAVAIAGPHADDKVEQIRATVGEFRRHRDLLDTERLRRLGTLRAARALRQLSHVHRSIRRRALLFVIQRDLVPVDEDMTRVFGRLAGISRPTVAAARRWLRAQIAQEGATSRDAVIYLRHHAQHTCLESAPHCPVCPLKEGCPARHEPVASH